MTYTAGYRTTPLGTGVSTGHAAKTGKHLAAPTEIHNVTPQLLDAASALTNPGSLLSPCDEILAPYDLEVSNSPAEGYRALGLSNGICNAALAEFNPDYAVGSRVHVINGMGVTLGDSVIGLTALVAIKTRFPHVSFTIYRPAHAPGYVERLYELAAPLLGSVVDLPVKLDAIPYNELRIDLGNHLSWPKFASLPMIDFSRRNGDKSRRSPGDRQAQSLAERVGTPTASGAEGRLCITVPDRQHARAQHSRAHA